MAKVLLVNPNKWGRGITSIWIASHSAKLKKAGHSVDLFDCTFFKSWTVDETSYNTKNLQYKKTDYSNYISYSEEDIVKSLQIKIDSFEPDIIFWSAISSHIHGEGEYVNIQYGYELISKMRTNAMLITGGLQATSNPSYVSNLMEKIDIIISGESEKVLSELASSMNSKKLYTTKGISFKTQKGELIQNEPQEIINNLDDLGFYDYSLFEDKVFYRPYNGKVLRAVDYEMSRGCIYACEYCVETVIQRYYGFSDVSKRGSILRANEYLRNKSAEKIFSEIKYLHEELNIELFRCQDTNFLTIDRKVLSELGNLIQSSNLKIKLYIETRPEGINEKSIELLKKLKVDGIGMGVELSGDEFREDKLGRFASTNKIVKAFELLKKANIKRTSYNIIGLPEQNEDSILSTIEFNRLLDPDNATVAFYSPYIGTAQQIKSKEMGYFDDYEFEVDGQLRTLSKDSVLDPKTLEFYKEKFNYFIKYGLENIDQEKKNYGLPSNISKNYIPSVNT
tara:strand:- start:14336 stop:15859 length:1524 start_codon:yes stop_codon:yes gene_type:complete